MSWLSRSIANSLCLDDEEDDALEEDDHVLPQATEDDDVPPEDRSRESAVSDVDRQLSDSDGADSNSNHGGDEHLDYDSIQGRLVKEDLSELKDSLTRQFWGAASFLAPPPLPPPPLPLLSRSSNTLHIESKSGGAGLNNDNVGEGEELMEYEERESGECGELANCSLSEDYYENIIEDAVGITEEVLNFAMNIVHHPETWLDFPLSEEDNFDVKGFGSHGAFAIMVLLILAEEISCYICCKIVVPSAQPQLLHDSS